MQSSDENYSVYFNFKPNSKVVVKRRSNYFFVQVRIYILNIWILLVVDKDLGFIITDIIYYFMLDIISL